MSKASIETDVRDYGLPHNQHTYDNCHNYTCRKKCEKDGYNKAIEEFAERMYRKVADSGINQYKDSVTDMIDEIAEQMKGGAE